MPQSAPVSVRGSPLKRRLPSLRWLDGIEERKSTWIVAGCVGVVAVLATWLLGGFAAAPKPALPPLDAGKAIDTGQWRVVVQRATLSAKRPDGRAVPTGKAALTIEAELTNRTKASSNDIASLLRVELPAIAPKALPAMTLLRDRTILFALHPKMTERVALSWEIPLGTPIPDKLPVTIISKIHKERDNLIGGEGWFNPKPMAQVKLKVEAPDTMAIP
jgi:hypothetical protein